MLTDVGRLFNRAESCLKNFCGQFSRCEHRVELFLKLRTSHSHEPPWCGADGGFYFILYLQLRSRRAGARSFYARVHRGSSLSLSAPTSSFPCENKLMMGSTSSKEPFHSHYARGRVH